MSSQRGPRCRSTVGNVALVFQSWCSRKRTTYHLDSVPEVWCRWSSPVRRSSPGGHRLASSRSCRSLLVAVPHTPSTKERARCPPLQTGSKSATRMSFRSSAQELLLRAKTRGRKDYSNRPGRLLQTETAYIHTASMYSIGIDSGVTQTRLPGFFF